MTALEKAFADAAAAGITQQKIEIGGLSVNVARFGKGPPLLLLHGWPEFWLVWRPLMLRLEQVLIRHGHNRLRRRSSGTLGR